MTSRIKPKGFSLSEFYSEGKVVRARYKSDHSEWITIAHLKTAKQAQRLAELMNQQLQGIENNG